MKKATIFILFISIVCNSQTILNPGDLVVLAFENNTQNCNPSGNLNDVVYFACAQDILPNTVIDFTDNGWERAFLNFWGTTEGFYRFEYQGTTIPAGNVFSISFPNNSSNVQIWNPDWLFTNISGGITSINFTINGDQLFVMQGGTWNAPVENEGSYSGTLIAAFNNNSNWISNNSTSTSDLPISLQCFSTLVPENGGDYIYYSGPLTPVPIMEWQQRLNEPSYWTQVASCSDFQQSFQINQIPILEEDLLINPIEQTICQESTIIPINLQTNYQDVEFQWFENNMPDYNNAAMLNGETSSSFVPPNNVIGMHFYFCEITVNNCTRYSDISTISILPAPLTSIIQPN